MKNYSIFIILALTVLSFPAQAQSTKVISSNDVQSLDSNLQGCMKDSGCPMQLRLQLVDEIHAKTGKVLQKISQACVKNNYEGCFDPQANDVKEWHHLNENMQDMMTSMETASPLIANKNKPSDK